MHPVLQYEHSLLSSPTDIARLSYFQRHSQNRLQYIVNKQKQTLIRSANDQYSILRLLSLALLLKIFNHQSESNSRYLLKLKELIYESELRTLCLNKGILKQQLHQCFALQIRKMVMGEFIEDQIVGVFNCVPFFDEVVLHSLQEQMLHSSLQQFIWTKFALKIGYYQLEQPGQANQQDIIYLSKDNDGNVYVRSNKNLTENAVEFLSQSQDDQCERISYNEERSYLKTISAGREKNTPFFSQGKQNQHFLGNRLSNEIQSFDQKLQRKSKIKKTSSLWSFFCCGE